MKSAGRTLRLAVFVTAVIWWAHGKTHAQDTAPMSLAPPQPPAASFLAPGDLPSLQPAQPEPLPIQPDPVLAQPVQQPAPPQPLSVPASVTPVAAPPQVSSQPQPAPIQTTEAPAKDFVVEATEGQTPANPTGRQEPGVSMEWLYPAIVRLGQPVTCTLMVKSISINRLQQVVVRVRVPATVTVKGSEPKAEMEAGLLVWNLGNMEPGQERRLDINMIPTVRGSLACHAFVTFTGSSTAKFDVREPKLAINANAPKSALKGDVAIVALTVSNPGDARTDHVKVRVDLSEGLKYGNGKSTEIMLESLGANESRTFLLQCMAEVAGTHTCSAVATAECNLEAHCVANVNVQTPEVAVTVSGPKMRYLDRNATFIFKVTNPGTATANHVTLNNVVPVGFKVVSANGGAFHDFATRTVVWFMGNLEPGQSKEVSLELAAINPGEFKNQTTVTAARGLRAETEVVTRIEGLAGLLMELVDVQDPVEVGKELSYEIRLTNTGTKTETNLQLTCQIPEKLEFRGTKSSVGTPFKVEGRKLIFEPIPKLAPRADVLFRVNVLCHQAGDVRFQAQVTADGLETPVHREESTRVFGDDGEAATQE